MKVLAFFSLGCAFSAAVSDKGKSPNAEVSLETFDSCSELIKPRLRTYHHDADEDTVTSITVELYHVDATPELCGVERKLLRDHRRMPPKVEGKKDSLAKGKKNPFQFFAALYKSQYEDYTCAPDDEYKEMCTVEDDAGALCDTKKITICCDENDKAKLDIYNSDRRFDGADDLEENADLDECRNLRVGKFDHHNICHFEYEFDCIKDSSTSSTCILDDLYEPNDNMLTATDTSWDQINKYGTEFQQAYWRRLDLFLCSTNSDWYEFNATDIIANAGNGGHYIQVLALKEGLGVCSPYSSCEDPPMLPAMPQNTLNVELWVSNGVGGAAGPTLLRTANNQRGYVIIEGEFDFLGSDKFYLHVSAPQGNYVYRLEVYFQNIGDGDFCEC